MINLPLYTEVELPRKRFIIDYKTPLMLIGSCFTDNIGQLLEQNKFVVSRNPFGVVYNPISISNSLKMLVEKNEISENELIYHKHLWHSYSFHGSFSNKQKNMLLENANKAIFNAYEFLKKTSYLLVTFGTSYVYAEKETQKIVSNCHKIPDKNFNRYILDKEQIVSEWINLIERLREFNPNLKIIFTLSPVRHLRDGAHGNQLSKATLLLAIDEIITRTSGEYIEYFPAYEIVMDELRDYRFYADDMTHISNTATQIVFNRFGKCFFNSDTVNCMHEIEKITRASEHRLLTNNSVEIIRFAQQQIDNIKKLETRYTSIDLKKEKHYFENLINTHF